MTQEPESKARLVWLIVGLTTAAHVTLLVTMIAFTYGLGLFAFALVTVGGNLLASLAAFIASLMSKTPATARAISLAFGISAIIATALSAVAFMYLMVG